MELSKTRIMMVAPFIPSGGALRVALRALYHSKAQRRARMAKIADVFRRPAHALRVQLAMQPSYFACRFENSSTMISRHAGSTRAPNTPELFGMTSPSNCMPSDGVQVIFACFA